MEEQLENINLRTPTITQIVTPTVSSVTPGNPTPLNSVQHDNRETPGNQADNGTEATPQNVTFHVTNNVMKSQEGKLQVVDSATLGYLIETYRADNKLIFEDLKN